jgi:hypothetical protein
MVTAECDEMALAALMETSQAPWHEKNLVCQVGPICDV